MSRFDAYILIVLYIGLYGPCLEITYLYFVFTKVINLQTVVFFSSIYFGPKT